MQTRFGVLLNLLHKFLGGAVKRKYRCLPLKRLTKNDPTKANAQYRRSQEIFDKLHHDASNALQHEVDRVAEGVEVVRRCGLDNETRHEDGSFALWVNKTADAKRKKKTTTTTRPSANSDNMSSSSRKKKRNSDHS